MLGALVVVFTLVGGVVPGTAGFAETAIELAKSGDYAHARRSLFEWEDQRVLDRWPSHGAIRELEGLVAGA